MGQFEAVDARSRSMLFAHSGCREQPGERSLMAEQMKAEAGVIDTAAKTVDDHRANQSTIAMQVKSAADECQASWVGQGAAAVAQVVAQFMEESRRIDQALLRLSDGLRSTGTAMASADSEVAAGAQRLGSEAASNYHNLT